MLDLQISLSATTPDTVTIFDGTVWGIDRENYALVAAGEFLQPGSPSGELVQVGYDPIDFVSPNGEPVTIKLLRDGVLRVVVAAVVVADELTTARALPLGTAYCTPDGELLVRATGADVTLTPALILGELSLSVQVEAFTEAYSLSDATLEDGLARLNLRYLQLPYQQQHELLTLYERALLYHTGTITLYTQGRFLDAAATLQASHYLLATNGQTPDNSGPLLGGFLPYV